MDSWFWAGPAQNESRLIRDEAIKKIQTALEAAGNEMLADIAVPQGEVDLSIRGGIR